MFQHIPQADTNNSTGILKQKGVEVHSLEFFKHNVMPLIVTATVALAVVVAEVRIIFPNDKA